MNLTKVLFSRDMSKEEEDYLNFLSSETKVVWDENKVYFPIENGDLSVLYENQRIEKIKLKKLSVQYKDALAYIVGELLGDANGTNIRKTIKLMEKSM